MDTYDLFRRLGAGAKFDVKRFSADAARFQVGKRKYNPDSSELLQGLDFFRNKKSVSDESGALPTHQELQNEEQTEGGLLERNKEPKKKKKKKMISEITAQEDFDTTIQWTSSVEAKIQEEKKAKGEKKLISGKLEHLRKEKVNFFRNKHKIHVQGTDLPDPIATFQQLDREYKISSRLLQNILDAGFQVPTPIQMQAIPVMLHDFRVGNFWLLPYWIWEDSSFSIPILMQLRQPENKGFRALVISQLGNYASQEYILFLQLAPLVFPVDILVTTPNRLIYLLKQDPPGIDLTSVEWLIVDESDKLFEDGKTGFRDQLASIFLACTSHKVKRAMFSATFAYDVEQWCKLNLDNVVTVSIGARNSAVETVEQELLFVGSETGKLLAMRELVKKGFNPPVLVFVQSIERAKELFHELIYEGINVDVIHAERTQQQRDNTVHSFRAGKIWVLICTALLARGIDFKGVNLVINYDFPTSSVEYIHRIGRTGRAGNRGKAVTFFTEDDKPLLRSVANVIQQAGCPVPEYIKGFQKLLSFMFPVAGGMRPPQGLMPVQQQGFPMVSVMQPNMQGMMGMNYSSQMSQGPIAMQAGIPMGPMPAAGMPFLGQPPFLGMRPPGPQYTPDMQKQFAEEQQKRFEQQQKLLEEERKRRQFEEQKQKLRLLSSVKPKTGEKNRDDALEAIKGNLDGFSRDAKMHPTPASHPKKPDCPTSSHSTKTVSPSPAFLDEDEFSDFMQGPVEVPDCGPSSTARLFQSLLPTTPLGQLPTQKAGAQPLPPGQVPVTFALHGGPGQIPCFSTASASHSVQKAGPSWEEKLLVSCDISTPGQEQIKLNTPEVGHKAVVPGSSQNCLSLMARNGGAVDGCVSGPTTAQAEKTSDQNLSNGESGVGVFPSQDPVQPRMPPWIYNESLVPDAYKKILEATMTPTGIDTAKLYPILMSSGLPRETLGQIWALANRTTPGKLTKEELYTVLAMVAVTQRGVPAMSPDALNQFPAAPIPTLSGFPMALPTSVSQPTAMPSVPAGSMPLSLGQPIMGINLVGPVGGAAVPTSSGFMPAYPSNQVGKTEEDDFQDFQDASKSGSLDDSFTDFQEVSASSKTNNSQHGNSAPSLLMPLSGTKVSTDKYSVFKGISADKPSENPASFG
ncbi:hypothetical protein STEG23_025659, partial [Scotinomys teguina]